MIFPWVYELGKMVVMELNFPNLPDEKIAVGQWVVLWDEIPVRKIGNNIYEVYPEAKPYVVETLDEKLEKLARGFKFINITDCDGGEPINPYVTMGRNLIKEGTKYRHTSRGSVKRHHWESPKYFG